MAVTKRYDDLLQVPIEAAYRERVKKIADAEGISEAQVGRDIVYAGIDAREAESRTILAGENGSQTPAEALMASLGRPVPPRRGVR